MNYEPLDTDQEHALIEHAKLTKKLIERFKTRRNWKGLKAWERQLLESANEALIGVEEQKPLAIDPLADELLDVISVFDKQAL